MTLRDFVELCVKEEITDRDFQEIVIQKPVPPAKLWFLDITYPDQTGEVFAWPDQGD